MLLRRIQKRWRHRSRAARAEQSECFRVYDRDIPELPLAIDWYEGRLHLSLFEHPSIREEEEEALLSSWGHYLAEALNAEGVYTKVRRRMRGARQYTASSRRGRPFAVKEGGYRFLVDLESYLDTGLFLDHRRTRRMAAAEAEGRRALNLFAYTGSFTVHLAGGGARSVDTVDSSQRYLAWAEENLKLNQLDGPRCRFWRSDVRDFLSDAASAGRRYELIILDPPTFSNRKGGVEFSVLRDHGQLIRTLEAVTAPGAILYFSTNAKRFKLEDALMTRWEGREITRETIPRDFDQRDPHRCWRLVRRSAQA